ncbi:hypothetical protein PoB_003684100 [Plakobranchus ocellatus]|uniref:Uncharacterized protein n=1 Tax=Plakobranchus ocellatus TaxID=259542 RepID=A0AAV4AUV4_9GAST|nr:hypothetical protein PoB_003684100 [Plakobranchus ocellatus]
MCTKLGQNARLWKRYVLHGVGISINMHMFTNPPSFKRYDLGIAGGVDGTVAGVSALRSAGTLLSRVRVPPTAPWPEGGLESLRSPCCGLAIYKKQTNLD